MHSRFGKERFDQARLINIANALTAVRVLLVPVFVYLLISGRIGYALLVFSTCGLTDGLDGLLARLLKQRTVVGFYLDPIADKLLMASSFIVLAYLEIIPKWLTVLVISRDLFILVGSILLLLLRDSKSIQATFLSKINTAMQILTVVFFLAVRAVPATVDSLAGGWEPAVSSVVVGACALTTSVTTLQYLYVGIRKLSDA